MKIVLVQMPPNPRDTPPYDVALCSAILKRAGHEVSVVDVNNDMYHQVYKQRPYWKFQIASHQDVPGEALFEQKPELFEAAADEILSKKPDVVVFRTENGLINAIKTGGILREKSPGTPLVSSGAVTPDQDVVKVWKTTECFSAEGHYNLPFDYHIIGEDDLVLTKVLDALAAGRPGDIGRQFALHGKVIDATVQPVPQDLDALPFYDFTDFDFMRYADPKMMRLNVSRSCVKHCAFCIDWRTVRKFRCMSGDRWYEEYQVQLARHPFLWHIRHYDRLLNGSVKSLDRFCDLMIKKYDGLDRPPLIWGGDCVITEEMTPELLKKMYRAGCINLGVGFESGSERVRQTMDKGFFDNRMAGEFLRNCKLARLEATLNVMVGYPTETEKDFQETLDFIHGNKENIFEARITFPTLHVPPGSSLALNPARYGLHDTHDDKWTSQEGANNYQTRVQRFETLCQKLLDWNVRTAVNRRLIKTGAAVKNLMGELIPQEAMPNA
jgi:hypothetical protein